MSDNNDEMVTKIYNCKYCGTSHKIKLNKKIVENRNKYPFPYVTLHDTIVNGNDLKEVLAILYIDRDLQIRHAEIQEFGEGHLFSKEQVMGMVNPVMEEITILREEIAEKAEKIKRLRQKLKELSAS